ncbi:hypothetical protein KC19_2G082100 [Ceratodon purpureus]|uniref:Uncharacterized protein n=1 Tax=Ceratodon purpureus TaxID=3225 RepID=A0A8T0IUH0_CERPU|nr:hypothetical protein KC19_2G082100 [Ceratodon purpureus]
MENIAFVLRLAKSCLHLEDVALVFVWVLLKWRLLIPGDPLIPEYVVSFHLSFSISHAELSAVGSWDFPTLLSYSVSMRLMKQVAWVRADAGMVHRFYCCLVQYRQPMCCRRAWA